MNDFAFYLLLWLHELIMFDSNRWRRQGRLIKTFWIVGWPAICIAAAIVWVCVLMVIVFVLVVNGIYGGFRKVCELLRRK